MPNVEFNVTLKSVEYLASLSEETPAFTATLYINGKSYGKVQNAGHGGCCEYRGLTGDLERQFNDMARAATGDDFEPLDTLVYAELDKYLVGRDLKNALRSKWMIFDRSEGEFFTWQRKPNHQEAEIRKQLEEKYPCVFMNSLPFDEALALYMAEGDDRKKIAAKIAEAA